MRRVAVAGLICLAVPLAAQDKPADEAPSARVDKVFEAYDHTNGPGCSVAVVKDGRIAYERGYGMADLDHGVVNTPSTVFHVASVSKQFTAAAIVLLAQQGKLSLDDDVRKHLPQVPDFGATITLRNLIHHTSGLRDQWDLLGLAGWRYSLDLITDQDVMDMVSRQKELNFRPGEKHVYCNTGYTLLGQVVKAVSGKSLREFTTENIFRPLGMSSTHFRDDHAEVVPNQALGYEPEGSRFRLGLTNFDTVGATSLLTTVEDLARWDQNFYEPKVGGPALVSQILEPGRLASGKPLTYAFGLALGKYKGLPTVDHGGADAGYRSDLIRFPEQRFSVAVLCNTTANAGQLAKNVADVYLAGSFSPEAAKTDAAIALPEEKLKDKAGFYWSHETDRTLEVELKDGKLAVVADEERLEAEPLSETRFRLTAFPVTFEVQPGEHASRPKLCLVQDDPECFDPAEKFQPSAAELRQYAGTYFSDEVEAFYRVVDEGGKLTLTRLRHKPQELKPQVRDLFTGDIRVRFVRDGKGEVTGLLAGTDRARNVRFRRLPAGARPPATGDGARARRGAAKGE